MTGRTRWSTTDCPLNRCPLKLPGEPLAAEPLAAEPLAAELLAELADDWLSTVLVAAALLACRAW